MWKRFVKLDMFWIWPLTNYSSIVVLCCGPQALIAEYTENQFLHGQEMDLSAAPAVAAGKTTAQVDDEEVRAMEEAEEAERALAEAEAEKYEADRAAEEQEEAARRLMLEDEEKKQGAKGHTVKPKGKAKGKAKPTTVKQTKVSMKEVQQKVKKPTASQLLANVQDLRAKKKELLQLKQAKAKEVKVAEKKVQRLRKKADQLTNNDLMEVFMLRTSEEQRKMERELEKETASSSAASSSRR